MEQASLNDLVLDNVAGKHNSRQYNSLQLWQIVATNPLWH